MNYLTTVHTDVGIRKSTNQDSVLIETAVNRNSGYRLWTGFVKRSL